MVVFREVSRFDRKRKGSFRAWLRQVRRTAAENLPALLGAVLTIRGTGGEAVSKVWSEDTRRASSTVLGNSGKTRDTVYQGCRPRSVLPTKRTQW